MTKQKKIRDEILDELLSSYEEPEDLLGRDGVLDQLKKALIERALGAELSQHLGYAKGEAKPKDGSNHRNGKSAKTILAADSTITIDVPRDREGSFEPLLVKKNQRRLSGFDERVLALYARGMTVREIQAFLEEQYGVAVSPDLISRVTDVVLDEVTQWQNRPLERVYPVVIFDALWVKIRDEGQVKNKAVYLALGIAVDGTKDILGLWIEQTEGARFWLKVMNELRNRGVEDIFIAVVDGLKGFPEAINAVFPATQVQGCVVHLIRNSLAYVAWQDRKPVVQMLKGIYRAETCEAARQCLDEFAHSDWGSKYPTIAPLWQRHWEQVSPFLAYPHEVRRIIYTTNALESVNMRLRKIIKTRGHFPSDEAATKLIYLVLRNITKDWTMPPKTWRAAMTQFAILFGDRLAAAIR